MSKKLSLTTLTFITLVIAGCATPSSGIVPTGSDDMFTVTRQGDSFLVAPESLKAAALQEASVYCTKKSLKMKFIHSKETPAGALGRWPESEVLFKCE